MPNNLVRIGIDSRWETGGCSILGLDNNSALSYNKPSTGETIMENKDGKKKNTGISEAFRVATFSMMADQILKNLKEISSEELFNSHLRNFQMMCQNDKTTKAIRVKALEVMKAIIEEGRERKDINMRAIQLDAKTGEVIQSPFGSDPLDLLIQHLEEDIAKSKDTAEKLDNL
jgi:hypothetical protein